MKRISGNTCFIFIMHLFFLYHIFITILTVKLFIALSTPGTLWRWLRCLREEIDKLLQFFFVVLRPLQWSTLLLMNKDLLAQFTVIVFWKSTNLSPYFPSTVFALFLLFVVEKWLRIKAINIKIKTAKCKIRERSESVNFHLFSLLQIPHLGKAEAGVQKPLDWF